MKMTFTSIHSRLFIALIIAQFLNVQIQTAFATDAVIKSSEEAQSLAKKIENRITVKFADKSEKQLNRMAYKLYKLSVKLTNKAIQNSGAISDEPQLTEEDQDTLSSFGDTENGTTAVTHADADSVQQKINQNKTESGKSKVLTDAKALLVTLGSKVNDDGNLSKATPDEFQNSFLKLIQPESRAPASAGKVIVKIILSLLIIVGGLAIYYFSFLFIIVLAWSAIIGEAWMIALLLMITAGTITGLIFAIKAVVTAENERLNNEGNHAISFSFSKPSTISFRIIA